MKQQWTAQELIDHWTFTQEEIALVQNIGQTDYNRLGYGLLLKYFQREGKIPQRKQDIPVVIVGHIAQQLHIGLVTTLLPPDSNPYRKPFIQI